MAHGERFALPIPILASIYRGLTEITTSTNLGTGDIIFPIQYVYGWIGAYFNSYYQAHHYNGSRICRIAGEKMARSFDLSGARRLRSSHVTLRCDDHFVMEIYSPHRFSRQFGFVQDLPGNFSKRPYDDTLEELVRLWDFCTHLSSSSTISIPPHPERPLKTNRYANLWYIGRPNLVGQNKVILKVPLHPSEQGKSSTSSIVKSKMSPLCSNFSPSRAQRKEIKTKHKRKKAKDQSSEFVDLDNATIDSEAFSVNDPNSTMPLTELAEQLNLQGIFTDTLNGIFYGVTSPSYLDTSSLPIIEALTNNMEVMAAQAKSPKVYAPSLCLSSFVAPNFEPQEMISTFKKSYIL
ncbi:hypothetical protein CQW23_00689 [Capsicum baccatum]|uniref:Aminotransferase-like plant mobile domain-containing protein n=1 Tax=Capsicum baccatum TaxID=33114 RepID=A0A2G2XLG0_CAPBA|nr:hypothetical protein CQW23_00689 [Capsicum baccatum]